MTTTVVAPDADLYADQRVALLRARAKRFINRTGFDLVRYPGRLTPEWHLTQLFARLGIDTVIDGGANHGQYARWVRSLGFTGWIESVEPVPDVFARLSATMRRDARWRGHNVALGEREGIAPINVAGGDGQASSLLAFNDDGPARWGDDHRVRATIDVPVTTLQRLLAGVRAERPDARIYVKLDTQGTDLLALRSAGEELEHVLAFQAEVAQHQFYHGMATFGDAFNGYSALGYALTGVFPLTRELDGLRVIEFDTVWMRSGV